jgi:hypothetical protein
MSRQQDSIEWPFRQFAEPAEMSFEVSVTSSSETRDPMVSVRFPALRRSLLLTPNQAAMTADALNQASAEATRRSADRS